jgi:hypothetical protein
MIKYYKKLRALIIKIQRKYFFCFLSFNQTIFYLEHLDMFSLSKHVTLIPIWRANQDTLLLPLQMPTPCTSRAPRPLAAAAVMQLLVTRGRLRVKLSSWIE